MLKWTLSAAGAALLCVGAQAAAPIRPEVPVMVGGDAEQDACGGTYQVVPLNPRGDNFVSVRSRPAVAGRELARLRSRQGGYLCSTSADGQWQGVVYAPPGSDMDCGVGTPITRSRPYRGPCTSGWVASRFLELVAG
jgi:hypothetical protein